MAIWGSILSGLKNVGKGILGFGKNAGKFASNILPGLSGAASSAVNYVGTSKGLQDQYKYNTLLQRQSQQWATGIASTAHQLEVKDLKKAGLNPILSVTGGSGASAPGATGGSVGMPDYNLGEGLFTALQFREQKNKNKVAESTASQLDDLGANLRSQTRGQAWKHMQEQFTYDEIQPLQKQLFQEQIKDIKNQIKNRDAATAGMLKRYQAMNFSDIFNAYTGRLVGSANAYNTKLQSAGLKADNDFFSSPYGKFIRGLGHTTGAIGNIFKGGYSFSGK